MIFQVYSRYYFIIKSQQCQQLHTDPLSKYCSQGPHLISQGPHWKVKVGQARRSKGPLQRLWREPFFFPLFETTKIFTSLKGPHWNLLTGPFSLNSPLLLTHLKLFFHFFLKVILTTFSFSPATLSWAETNLLVFKKDCLWNRHARNPVARPARLVCNRIKTLATNCKTSKQTDKRYEYWNMKLVLNTNV